VKEQRIIKKIENQASKFKQRALKSPEDRKRHDQVRQDEKKWMWRAHNELGWSFAKIGSIFNRDPRTVRKVTKIFNPKKETRVEQKPQEEILLQKAQQDHLDEIRSLVVEWKSSLRTPIVRSIFVGMPSLPTQGIDANPLFDPLREHLPFPPLWKNYSMWKDRVVKYVDGCQELMKAFGEAKKMATDEYSLKVQWGEQTLDEIFSLTHKSLSQMLKAEQMMKEFNGEVEADARLNRLQDELGNLEASLNRSLEKILLRRDYINYRCRLCPAQRVSVL